MTSWVAVTSYDVMGKKQTKQLQPIPKHRNNNNNNIAVLIVSNVSVTGKSPSHPKWYECFRVSTPNNERQIHEKHYIHDYFYACNYKKFKLDSIGIFARIFRFRFVLPLWPWHYINPFTAMISIENDQ